MRLFLIGLPGSGKSTIGSDLSQLLGYTLIDTDEEICKKENSNIDDIFKTKGENYFREIERKTLNEVIQHDNSIISTGGGTPCFYDNMEIINKHGVSIFLNVPLEEISHRLLNHANKNRPLILGKSPEQLMDFLKDKIKERSPFYKKATLEFQEKKLSAKDIVSALKEKGYPIGKL
jgi:shikimate kinase